MMTMNPQERADVIEHNLGLKRGMAFAIRHNLDQTLLILSQRYNSHNSHLVFCRESEKVGLAENRW